MNSVSKRIIAAVMVFALLFTASVQSFAAGGDLAWEALWEKEGDSKFLLGCWYKISEQALFFLYIGRIHDQINILFF